MLFTAIFEGKYVFSALSYLLYTLIFGSYLWALSSCTFLHYFMKFLALRKLASLLSSFLPIKPSILYDYLSQTKEFLKLTASNPKVFNFPVLEIRLILLSSKTSLSGWIKVAWLQVWSGKLNSCTELSVISFFSSVMVKGKNKMFLSSE